MRRDGSYKAIQKMRQVTRFFGRKTAAIYAIGYRRHCGDDIVRVVNRWQLKINRAAVASWR